MADDREWFERILDLQLERNPRPGGARATRVDEDTHVRLEFFYVSPGEAEARSLVRFLRDETDYDVQAFERREGMDENTPWLVVGLTQPTPLSLDLVHRPHRRLQLALRERDNPSYATARGRAACAPARSWGRRRDRRCRARAVP